MNLSPDQAIADCRRAHPIEGTRWAGPLITYLDDPPSERRVFEWLTLSVGDILDDLGANTEELQGALSLIRSCTTTGNGSDAIEGTAWQLWLNRTDHPERTAVAQLCFAVLAYREQRTGYRSSCAAPLNILNRLAADRGEILERVIANFSEYAGR